MNKNFISKPDASFWKGKNVLVTGHTGFKGSWLSLWLLKMNSIVSGISLEPEYEYSLFNKLKIKKDINHKICDVRNKEQIKNHIREIKPDIVFHLAAQPLVVKSYDNPVETWETNVLGTINVLEAIRLNRNECTGIFITTDKVYKNNEWIYGYRETDELGGYDPYSSSKAASELAIASWRASFLNQKENGESLISITSARAGNVIGGGDWSENRIIPDIVRSLKINEKIKIRNPSSTRPWQHVLEPLCGYLILAERLNHKKIEYSNPFNFGPFIDSNRTVKELVDESIKNWHGEYFIDNNQNKPHEAGVLSLSIEKAIKYLDWQPKWDFSSTIEKTIKWYKKVHFDSKSEIDCSLDDLNDFLEN